MWLLPMPSSLALRISHKDVGSNFTYVNDPNSASVQISATAAPTLQRWYIWPSVTLHFTPGVRGAWGAIKKTA